MRMIIGLHFLQYVYKSASLSLRDLDLMVLWPHIDFRASIADNKNTSRGWVYSGSGDYSCIRRCPYVTVSHSLPLVIRASLCFFVLLFAWQRRSISLVLYVTSALIFRWINCFSLFCSADQILTSKVDPRAAGLKYKWS